MRGKGFASRGLTFAILLALLAASRPALSEDDARLLMFIEANRCLLTERLDIVHSAHSIGKPNPFIVVSLSGEPQSYVQCMFLGGGSMLCEASSGYYAQLPGEPRKFQVSATGIAALGQLGFATGVSEGNYQKLLDANGSDDLVRIAELILSALFSGYHAWPNAVLDIKAPLAPLAPAETRCTPVG